MKITKSVRRLGTAVLLTLGAVSYYAGIRARDAYEEMKVNYRTLMRKIADVRESLDVLSGKISEFDADSGKKQVNARQDSEKKEYSDENINVTRVERDGGGNGYYTVREYKGIVGVFDERGRILREEDVMVASLSPDDRQSLELGIRVKTEEELERLLEDWN